MTFEIVQRSEMLRLVIAFRSKAVATQPLMSCRYPLSLKPYDFLSHRFPLYFALPQAISTANVYAGGQTG
jgi:hypothetical protein